MNHKVSLCTVLIVGVFLCGPVGTARADNSSVEPNSGRNSAEAPGTADTSATKQCLKSTLECCTDRAKQSADTVDELMQKLDQASKGGDPAQMKLAIDEACRVLGGIKELHNKSYHLLNAATKHLEKVRKNGNATVKQLIDETDPSFDEVIWAY